MRSAILGCTLALAPAAALAQDVRVSPRITAEQTTAVGINENESDNQHTRFEIKPEARIRLPDGWSSEIALRFEAVDGDMGLGTRDTYSSMSRPIRLSDDVHIELDRAILSWRKGGTRLRIGKQTFAWGVLDGLQVTDRLDPSRRREAIFFANRPDRIARWSARAEFETAGLLWDAAAIIDGTADQLAQLGDPFAVNAPRFRGGLPANAPLPALRIEPSQSPTFGLKATKPLASGEISILGFHGPETEPVYQLDQTGVTLVYPERTLLGGNIQIGSGAQVWRAEIAWVPDQPVNINNTQLLITERNRVLGGVGLDWTMRGGVFLNAQLGVDWIDGDFLVRPNTDVISTVRLQKAWANDTIRGGVELISSLSDGDRTLRPSLAWQASDALRFEVGIDMIWGTKRGLIGQFDDQDRIWVKVRLTG